MPVHALSSHASSGAASREEGQSERECRVGERMSRNYCAVRRVYDHSGMALNFIGCDRDQSFLLPPDVRDWLPEGHLAWFVLDAVAGMNLGEFYAAYRADGVGRRAYDPAMLASAQPVVATQVGL